MEYTTHKGYQIRPGTMDDYVVNEIRSYKGMLVRLCPGDIVLDIGANIGSFAKVASTKVLKPVIAVEPEPENFELLKINAPDCQHIQAAVVGPDHCHIGMVSLYLNKGTNKGLHSTVPTRGRDIITVPAISFDELLDEHQPTQIKIDCEGAEYEFLRPKELPGFVRGVIIEYNLSRNRERELAMKAHEEFDLAGWTIAREPRLWTKAWAAMAQYVR